MTDKNRPDADSLFDRRWRPGHPFRLRIGPWRRWGMVALLLGLCALIGGYWYITDANRVRSMAEGYLTRLIGGPVKVGEARLGIFEGLRLSDVRVYVDDSGAADSLLFSADSFLLQYNPASMLRGRLEATRIVAIDPRVHLTENLDDGRWNYQRLARAEAPATDARPTGRSEPLQLPEILLRNAQFVYSEVRGGALSRRGSLDIEGRLWPAPDTGRYRFELQSRGEVEGVGPVVSGSVVLSTGQFNVRLEKFRFGQDIRSLLMAQVRGFWEQHQLEGRLDIPEFTFTPGRGGKKASFRVETELDGVTLVIHPDEFNSRAENQRLARIRGALGLMGTAGMNGGGLLDPLDRMFHPPPIQLERVAGTFVFTEEGIEIKRVSGRIETNAFRASGHIDGYSPDAAASIRIETPPTENLYIPHAPRYVDSMPPQVREVYDRFRPEGTARAWVELTRESGGARPEIKGEIEIIDGQFTFDHFPYPVRSATGKIVLGNDEKTGAERLDIKRLRGRGGEGTANANSFIEVNGHISPFGPTAGVNMMVTGTEIHSDPVLRAAFPAETREALRMLDPGGDGEFPKFEGSFACEVIRPVGYRTHWIINTDIQLDDASGALVAFPYPLEKVAALLRIREGYVEIVDAKMRDGEASLKLDGRVHFGHGRPVTPDLVISAKNVPIDRKLLDALPAERREWLEKVGLTGRLDIEGRIYGADSPAKGEGKGAGGIEAREAGFSQQPDPVPSGENGLTGAGRPRDMEGEGAAKGEGLAGAGRPRDMEGEGAAKGEGLAGAGRPREGGGGGAGGRARGPGEDLGLDLSLRLRDGSIWPGEGTFALGGLEGEMTLSAGKLVISRMVGRRGEATIGAAGEIVWAGRRPRAKLAVTATDLRLDESLHQLLPEAARAGWDALAPRGTVDATLRYAGALGSPTTRPVPLPAIPLPTDSTTRPAEAGDGIAVTIKPRKLSVTPSMFAYQLDDVLGTVTVAADKVTLADITAKHGDATVRLSGTGTLGPRDQWELALDAKNVPVDEALRAALPESLASIFAGIKLEGAMDVAFKTLKVTTAATRPSAETAAGAATRPADRPVDVEFAATVRTTDASLNVGVPLGKVNGSATFAGRTVGGRMAELAGSLSADSLTIAGRDATGLSLTAAKGADEPLLTLGDIHAKLAGGDLAGTVRVRFGDDTDSTYALSMLLRDASVGEIAGQEEMRGRLTASLDLEGQWNDPRRRRGRGDVSATGRNMYQIPVVLGLLEIANLSLPINSPFNEATARYMVQGPRVTFEAINLRSDNMEMRGTGVLDFDTNQVRMTFTTNNPNWPKVPFIGDLIQGARDQLLQIHVRGTIGKPKVSASAMNTVTTTVDEVFGNER